MSKYKEALEAFTHIGLCDACGSNNLEKLCEDIIEALEIADRLEHADADVYNKCCEVCTSLTICKERGEVCDEASAWEDGYNQALADIRGDNNG